jgi:hypothetical protein
VTGASQETQHHGPSHTGSVVLDVGGDIGALVLHTSPELLGQEIDIVGLGPGTVSTHALVRPRVLPAGVLHAAVYPDLPQGRYRVEGGTLHRSDDVEVTGGVVTELDWTVASSNRIPDGAGALS